MQSFRNLVQLCSEYEIVTRTLKKPSALYFKSAQIQKGLFLFIEFVPFCEGGMED